jgi:hypothetical protein
MSAEFGKDLATVALDQISFAFVDRAPPSVMTTSLQLSDYEYQEVMSYAGLHWRDVTFDQVVQNSDAVFWFGPEAFCYYLPGILAAGLKDNRTDSNAYDSLIGMLDRSPEPDYWDDFFLPRWTLLTPAEVESVAAWARWLEVVEPEAFPSNTYERVQVTLTLLKEKHGDS